MRNNSQKAFTLIELMVTISIMVLLTSVVLANFGGLSLPRNVKIGKDNLASNLRAMQSFSLASKDVNGVPSRSYGIKVTSVGTARTYDLVAYNNVGVSTIIKTINLPANIYIRRINLTKTDASTSTATTWEGQFNTPYARVVQTYSGGSFSGTNDPNVITVITLGTSDDAVLAVLTINGLTGSISE